MQQHRNSRLREQVGRNIRAEAKRNGITIRALSEALGFTSEQQLHYRLAGKTAFTLDEFMAIAATLDTALADLLRDTESASYLGQHRNGCIYETAASEPAAVFA